MRGLMYDIMEKTRVYEKRLLNILVNYGGKYELVEAFKKIAANAAKTGKTEIDEKAIEGNLLVRSPLDLIIRTGGYHRLSGFMPWQSVYAEMYFTETLLPDFSKREFTEAIRWYSSVKRNFGA